ncbi:MAG: M56 family metallopeptidase [Lachnospiraceae bacterium]|nr:M56 family metallopeptidase [Lachnospiraceae bacterium]
MINVFLRILDMAVAGTFVILAVLLVRGLMRGIPKKYVYALWLIVGIRLVCPVAVSSPVSLFNLNFAEKPYAFIQEMAQKDESIRKNENPQEGDTAGSQKQVSQEGDTADSRKQMSQERETDNSQGQMSKDNSNENTGQQNTEAQMSDRHTASTNQNPEVDGSDVETADTKKTGMENTNTENSEVASGSEYINASSSQMLRWLSVIWLAGMITLISWNIILTVRLRKKLEKAVLFRDNIYESDVISSPFVMGVFSARIYIPFRLSDREREYILKHEQYHVRRRDNITKMIAFLITAVYWFHPLVWLSWFCMVKDMEMSCDEHVLSEMEDDVREDYSRLLLAFAANSRRFSLGTLAFGETSIRNRVKHVLKFEKGGKELFVPAIIVFALVGIVCLTNGQKENGQKYTEAPDEFWQQVQEEIEERTEVFSNGDNSYCITTQVVGGEMLPCITQQKPDGTLVQNHKVDDLESLMQVTDAYVYYTTWESTVGYSLFWRVPIQKTENGDQLIWEQNEFVLKDTIDISYITDNYVIYETDEGVYKLDMQKKEKIPVTVEDQQLGGRVVHDGDRKTVVLGGKLFVLDGSSMYSLEPDSGAVQQIYTGAGWKDDDIYYENTYLVSDDNSAYFCCDNETIWQYSQVEEQAVCVITKEGFFEKLKEFGLKKGKEFQEYCISEIMLYQERIYFLLRESNENLSGRGGGKMCLLSAPISDLSKLQNESVLTDYLNAWEADADSTDTVSDDVLMQAMYVYRPYRIAGIVDGKLILASIRMNHPTASMVLREYCVAYDIASKQIIERSEIKKVKFPEAPLAMNDADNEADSKETTTETYVAQNEEYGLALPNGKIFGDILQDFVYWEYATTVENDDKSSTIIGRLYDKNSPKKEYKINLYYQELDIEEMDEVESGRYHVVVTFPEEKDLSYFSFYYNARGLESYYDYGYDGGWFKDNVEGGVPSQGLEKNKWFKQHYTSFGEAGLTISKAKAKEYEVKDKFAHGEKEQILSAIEKTIEKTKKKEKDLYVYVRDFLPADTNLRGKVVDLDIDDPYAIPLSWIRSHIYYSGDKMEKFEGVYWDAHYSIGYSGRISLNSAPTLQQMKKQAKEEKDAVDVDKCVLAYHIKNGKLIDLKSGDK